MLKTQMRVHSLSLCTFAHLKQVTDSGKLGSLTEGWSSTGNPHPYSLIEPGSGGSRNAVYDVYETDTHVAVRKTAVGLRRHHAMPGKTEQATPEVDLPTDAENTCNNKKDMFPTGIERNSSGDSCAVGIVRLARAKEPVYAMAGTHKRREWQRDCSFVVLVPDYSGE